MRKRKIKVVPLKDVQIHHVIAKTKSAFLLAKMGVGKESRYHADDLCALEALQKGMMAGFYSKRLIKLTDCQEATFARLAKYFKTFFPRITVTHFKEILRTHKNKAYTKKRNRINMNGRTRRSLTPIYKRSERVTLSVLQKEVPGRIRQGERKSDPYLETTNKILHRKIQEVVPPEIAKQLCKNYVRADGSGTLAINIRTVYLEGKLVFYVYESDETKPITDIFTGKQYSLTG